MRRVRVQGGFGNQLFGLAFARSLACLSGAPVSLDISGYGRDRFGRAYALAPLAAKIPGLSEAAGPWLGHPLAAPLLARLPFPVPGLHVEPAEAPAPGRLRALARPDGCHEGYWQHEAYIHDPDGFVALVREFVAGRATATASPPVALHYRTYGEETRAGRRSVPDRDYVDAALALIERRMGPVGRVAVVSDDIAAAMERLAPVRPGVTFEAASRDDPLEDFAALLGARALILTNSSFSWWAGFCGVADIVCYPRRGGLHHYPAPARRFTCV